MLLKKTTMLRKLVWPSTMKCSWQKWHQMNRMNLWRQGLATAMWTQGRLKPSLSTSCVMGMCHDVLRPVGCVGTALRWCLLSLSRSWWTLVAYESGFHRRPFLEKADWSVLIPSCSPVARDTWASSDSVNCLDLYSQCLWRTCHVLGILLGIGHPAGRTEKHKSRFLALWFVWVHGPQHSSPPTPKPLGGYL